MARAFRWLLPHPFLTLLLAIVWTLLQNDVSAGMVVFGVILGIIIPRMTSIWWPDTPQGFHLGKMTTYSIMVMWDIMA
jgi:multicomponent K+:H+ antiporter subunit E